MSIINTEIKDKKLFDDIAYDYIKKDLTPYCRIARKHRLMQSLKEIKQPIKNLIEVGCGAGFTAKYLKSKFINYFGVDYSDNLIKYAIEDNNNPRVKFICSNILEFNSSVKFDVVLMIGVLHHIPECERLIKSFKKILSPQGVIVVNEPQNSNPLFSLLRKIRKRFDNNYSTDQIEFSVGEICSIFERCGFDVKTYPQGIFSTPLAETKILPGFIGMPLIGISLILDTLLDKLFSTLGFKKLMWNIVVHAKLKNK